MKIENIRYVLKIDGTEETLYLTPDYGLDSDIREALMAKSIIAAKFIRSHFRQKYQCDFDIMSLKVTYEWE